MLDPAIRVLNFDDSILKQEKLISQYDARIIDLKDIARGARIWVNRKTRDYIEKRIEGSSRNAVTFLGSGDFHHISDILIGQFKEPISVIDFDFHPDWDIFSPPISCGSWVNHVLKRKNILKFILMGVSSFDISSFWIQAGNLKSLKDNRLQIYPYAHGPSSVYFRSVPENASLKSVERRLFLSKICWTELEKENLTEFFPGILKRLPVKKVYLSIDKDCLRNEYALTNWEEGMFSLEQLLFMLKSIKENLQIMGVDITGDYSPVFLDGWFKKIISSSDHPKDIEAKNLTPAVITATNEDTNLKILKALGP